MWLERVIYSPLFLFLLACADPVSDLEEPEAGGDPAQNTPVTLKAGEGSAISVFIFRRKGDSFLYQSTVDQGWSTEGQVTVPLEKGTYQFLFVRSEGTGTALTPHPLQADTYPEELRFNALPDPDHEGEILPVNELFLPEPAIAAQMYTIQGGETVTCTLKRAVSRLLLILKRGHAENGVYVPEPYPAGTNILQTIQEAQVTISGVATSAHIRGTEGVGTLSTTFSEAKKDSLSQDGFAFFTGPFFFPPDGNGVIRVSVTLLPTDGTAGETIRKVVTGNVKKNEQLRVVLWIEKENKPSVNRVVGVTVDTQPISKETEGDQGIWQ